MPDHDTLYRSLPVQDLRLADATLPYRCHGTGPDLLLVHGFPLSGYTWRKVLPALAERHRCHIIDLAGLGGSVWDEKTDFSFEGHARRLKALVDHLGLQRYDLLSQDTGATITRCLALMDPARARRQVMINTEIPGHRPPWIVEYQYLMRLPFTPAVFRLLLKSRAFQRSAMAFGGCFDDLDLIDGDFHREFIAPCVSEPRRIEGLRDYLIGANWPTVDAFATRHAEFHEPVLLLWGEDDPTFPLPRARAMLPQFRDARMVTIPRAKLLPQEEKPGEVAKAVLEFLSG
ncbi:alpha/beta fold hydrolase [Solimonas sp. K1W22B-7]|uniref:alpha/beta fold hydrolase n=1 Tax=Solimonas sp. K1W22B-7 TaxID=2303331 RepID=UPI0013C48459|nr:alpha/beta hydrolase [Solimonas sp. K1W22B-7]